MSNLKVEQNTTRTIATGTTETYDTVIVEGNLIIEGTLNVVGGAGNRFPRRGTFPNTFPPTR